MVSKASLLSTTWGKHQNEKKLPHFLYPSHVTNRSVPPLHIIHFFLSLSHFVVTLALLDRIKESQPSRIVIMSSLFHEKATGINYDTIFKTGDTPQPHHQPVYDRYARSKLANVLFARALARHVINEPHLYVNACHPGYVSTRATQPTPRQEEAIFSRCLDGLEEWFHSLVAWPVERGVLTQLYLATSPEIESREIRGRYFGPIANEIEPCKCLRCRIFFSLCFPITSFSIRFADMKLFFLQFSHSHVCKGRKVAGWVMDIQQETSRREVEEGVTSEHNKNGYDRSKVKASGLIAPRCCVSSSWLDENICFVRKWKRNFELTSNCTFMAAICRVSLIFFILILTKMNKLVHSESFVAKVLIDLSLPNSPNRATLIPMAGSSSILDADPAYWEARGGKNQ